MGKNSERKYYLFIKYLQSVSGLSTQVNRKNIKQFKLYIDETISQNPFTGSQCGQIFADMCESEHCTKFHGINEGDLVKIS